MGQNINKIKTRIRSVSGAYKVTSAMKLVSSVKLKTWRYKLTQNQDFSHELKKACENVFSFIDENVNSPLINPSSNSDKRLFIVVSSSLGLCGAYNSNIFKMCDVAVKENDEAIILGKKGMVHYAESKFSKLEIGSEYSSIKDESIIKELLNFIVNEFTLGSYKEIHLLFTKYKNPITFIPTDITLLPLRMEKTKQVGYPPLLEPSKEELLKELIPFYLKNTLYSCLLESEVCEQASRSNAMENATQNAEELLSNLQIEFSKARQGAITQEIIEIVGASNAL